jgi:hypothetical protein
MSRVSTAYPDARLALGLRQRYYHYFCVTILERFGGAP